MRTFISIITLFFAFQAQSKTCFDYFQDNHSIDPDHVAQADMNTPLPMSVETAVKVAKVVEQQKAKGKEVALFVSIYDGAFLYVVKADRCQDDLGSFELEFDAKLDWPFSFEKSAED